MLNYNSFHPMSMKINVAENFIKRVIKLTTDTTDQQHRHKIFQLLRQNSYPSSLINRLLNRTRYKQNNSAEQTGPKIVENVQQHTNPQSPKQTPMYRSLHYIPHLSTAIIRTCQSDYPQIKIALRTNHTIQHILPKIKDPINPLECSNIIYSIPCECGHTYIGMSKNQLKARLGGHRSNINISKAKHPEMFISTNTIHTINNDRNSTTAGTTDTPTTTPSDIHKPQLPTRPIAQTALIQHMMTSKHEFDLMHTKILDRTYRSSHLPVLEMCHIVKTENTVNYRTDVENLNSIYAGILHATGPKQNIKKRENTREARTADDDPH